MTPQRYASAADENFNTKNEYLNEADYHTLMYFFFSNKCIYYSIFVGPLPTYTSSSDKIKIIIIMNLRPYNNFLFELCFRLLVKSLKTCCLKKILLGSRICIPFFSPYYWSSVNQCIN